MDVLAVVLFMIALVMAVGMGILYASNKYPMEDDVACLIRLFVSVVKCDGKADAEEIAAVKSYINSSPRWGIYIIKYFEQELSVSDVKFLGYEWPNVPLFVLNRKKKTVLSPNIVFPTSLPKPSQNSSASTPNGWNSWMLCSKSLILKMV